MLTLYDDEQHIVPDVTTYKVNIDCCINLVNQALASDSPVYYRNIDFPMSLDDETHQYYLGITLKSPEKIPVGVLSLFSTKAYHFEPKNEQLLIVLAQSIADKLVLYKKERELKDLEEFSSLITDTNQDYIFVKDSQYRLVRANPSFMALHPEEIRKYLFSADWSKAYKQDEAETFIKYDAIAFKEGRSETEERITLPNGESLLLYTTKTRFEDRKGNQYILGVSRDISEREQLLTDLQKSNHDLDEFAYIASGSKNE
jgi:PAS domain S-box-containing protein